MAELAPQLISALILGLLGGGHCLGMCGGLMGALTLAIPPEGLSQLAVRPLLPRINREIMLVHRRNRALSPVAQAAWDLVRDVAAQQASSARRRISWHRGME